MVYKVLKRVAKPFKEIFSKQKSTHMIEVRVGDSWIQITEQQCGSVFSPPHPALVRIYAPNNKGIYTMDYNTFLEKIAR